MKILIKSRNFVERLLEIDPSFILGSYFISIFSSGDDSPFPNRFNVLKLNFDDVSNIPDECHPDKPFNHHTDILFTKQHAKEIHNFLNAIGEKNERKLYIHCDNGIRRSGAIGVVLNEYFNKNGHKNQNDLVFFNFFNNHISPNPYVERIMRKELFDK
jgi:predicted protein tyrosine phosphatase